MSNGKRPILRPTKKGEIVFIILFALAFIFGIVLLAFSMGYKNSKSVRTSVIFVQNNFREYNVSSTEQLKKRLKLLYVSYKTGTVRPYILKSFPNDFNMYPSSERVKLFVKVMIPIAIVANRHFEIQHKLLLEISSKIKHGIRLSKAEQKFLTKMVKLYKTKSINTLLRRVNGVPVSLLLAQAAIESGWGSSYFTRRYNNIYGLHRINRGPNEPVVKEFKSLYAATISYIMNLNTNSFYKKFRIARASMGNRQNPYVLSKYLMFYSIKRYHYVELVDDVLSQHELLQYDDFKITSLNLGFNLL